MRDSTRLGISALACLGLLLLAAPALAQSTAGTLNVVDGAVGIGTDDPADSALLHVMTATTGPVDAIYLENMTGPARINLQNHAVVATDFRDPKWTINSNGSLRFTAGTDGPEMKIDAAGNVFVEQAVLVAGTELDVPDYVFEPDYELMPLDELESFVQENRHLPDVPSAKEVKSQGLDMTRMQLRLLRKVEELTLYTIQQQETIERLEAKIADLEDAPR